MMTSSQRTLKKKPCIEIPADWSNEKAELARKSNGALCIELWGNRRMLRATPDHAADLREQITARRENSAEQAWLGPMAKLDDTRGSITVHEEHTMGNIICAGDSKKQ